MDIFKQKSAEILKRQSPLADRMRPRTLDEFIGQEHIVGPGRLLRRAIQIDQLSSLIFYGPPGTGKTTLARIIANTTKSQFLSINAVLAGIADIRSAIEEASKCLELYQKRTILFIDEVHRFNKSQQDALLPHVENGLVVLIGATTENPYFEVNKALVSRSRIFRLRKLEKESLAAIALQAIKDQERGYGNLTVVLRDDALDHLVNVANGDARGVLNALELAVETTRPDKNGAIVIDRQTAEESIQQRAVLYDKDGDAHYDTISAFIKSVRGSDVDAALYWMAKMVTAGEDPRFIFRRMLILASEDVGMADPHALAVVSSAAQAFDYVGLPEGRFHLSHACIYLATAPKSNSSMAFFDALSTVEKEVDADTPAHLRDASRDAEGFGDGKGYLYPHAYRDHWVSQQYLPDALQGKVFYQPSTMGYEQVLHDRVSRLREAQIAAIAEVQADESGASQKSQWIKRTSQNGGGRLARIRDDLFAKLSLRRDAMALDFNARTGLLTFEAVRQAPEGTVWSLVFDKKDAGILDNLVRQLAPLSRPQIVITTPEDFDIDLCKAAGNKPAFDAIIGRNVFTRQQNRVELLKKLTPLLAPHGTIALAETVASQGQRITEAIKFPATRNKYFKLLKKAEDRLFTDKNDGMVNWNGETLKREIDALGGVSVTVEVAPEIETRRLLPDEIEYWFRGDKNQKSLGDYLREACGAEEVKAIRETLHASLDNRDVPWKVATAYIKILKSG